MSLDPDNWIIRNRVELGRELWDGFVDSSEEAWLGHRYDWQEALAIWPGKSDLSFAILEGNSGGGVIAVVPLHLTGCGRYWWSWSVIDSMGGPACSDALGDKYKQKVKRYALEHIRALARRQAAVEVNLELSAMSPLWRGDNCPRVNPLLYLGCQNTLSQTWVVDLRPGIEQVWSNLETRARTAIRKAEKQGVTVRPARRPGDLEIYYNLHTETYQRTKVRPYPKAYFAAIWKDFLEKGLAHIIFAEWNGEVVAAENFGVYKQAAVYWTGAASKNGLLVAANSLLQWTAMQWMAENGLEWYETGEAFPQLREGKLKGLNDFKKSFGGKIYPYYRGQIVLRKGLHALLAYYRDR